MALFFILAFPEYTVLTFLLICRSPDLHSTWRCLPRVRARFKKQAFYIMEFLKYKKVTNPCATMRGKGGPEGHVDTHSPVFPTPPLSFLRLSLWSSILPASPRQRSVHLPSIGKNRFHFSCAFYLLSGL